jgi:hypothetical protein
MPNVVKRSTGTDTNFAFVYATPQPNFGFCVNPTPQHTHVIKDIKNSTQYSWATIYRYPS